MAELRLRSARKSKASYDAVLTNLGPDTVILSAIEGTNGVDRFFVGEPLHRNDLELLPDSEHRFMVAPSLSDALPLEVDITFTDDSGNQIQQAGLHLSANTSRDRASHQPQDSFPRCRCSSTACSVIVSRNRVISA